jgi:hypothetical protein
MSLHEVKLPCDGCILFAICNSKIKIKYAGGPIGLVLECSLAHKFAHTDKGYLNEGRLKQLKNFFYERK